jgi:hypothetical protein
MLDIKLSLPSYLYASPNGDIEVFATGRYVSKVNATGSKYRLLEVEPIDIEINWKKFVSEYLLSKIECET